MLHPIQHVCLNAQVVGSMMECNCVCLNVQVDILNRRQILLMLPIIIKNVFLNVLMLLEILIQVLALYHVLFRNMQILKSFYVWTLVPIPHILLKLQYRMEIEHVSPSVKLVNGVILLLKNVQITQRIVLMVTMLILILECVKRTVQYQVKLLKTQPKSVALLV